MSNEGTIDLYLENTYIYATATTGMGSITTPNSNMTPGYDRITIVDGNYQNPIFRVKENGPTIYPDLELNYQTLLPAPIEKRVDFIFTYTIHNNTNRTVRFRNNNIRPSSTFTDTFIVKIPADEPICLHADTLVKTTLGDVKISTLTKDFAGSLIDSDGNLHKLLFNSQSSITRKYIKIEKDAFGPDKPSIDTFITFGHPIMVDGLVIYPSDLIKDNKNPKVSNVLIDIHVYPYTLCTNEKVYIMMNNIPVATWGAEDFEECIVKKGIHHIKL